MSGDPIFAQPTIYSYFYTVHVRFYTSELLFRNSLPLHLSPIFKVNLRRGSLAKTQLLRRTNPPLDIRNMQALPRTHFYQLSTTFEWPESRKPNTPRSDGTRTSLALGISLSELIGSVASRWKLPFLILNYDFMALESTLRDFHKHKTAFQKLKARTETSSSKPPAGPPDIYEYRRSIFYFGIYGIWLHGCQLSTCHFVSSA